MKAETKWKREEILGFKTLANQKDSLGDSRSEIGERVYTVHKKGIIDIGYL